MCAQFELLGITLGAFMTLKDQSEHNRGQLIIQSLLQFAGARESWIQASRDSLWRGLLATVSGRTCTVNEFDLTANSLNEADEDAVMAVLNKLAVDGVSKLCVGHAFLKYPSIAVRVVDCVTTCCASHHLKFLNLTGTLIGNDGAVALSRSLGQRAVAWPQELHLSKCNISDAGCIVLMEALLQCLKRNETSIDIVNLSHNSITDDAMATIAPIMVQIVELHVYQWSNVLKETWKLRQSLGRFPPRDSAKVDRKQSGCISINELNMECNVISEIGFRHLISSFLCKTILKLRAAALSRFVQQNGISSDDLAEYFEDVNLEPVVHYIKVGGNLFTAPRCKIMHVCTADPSFAQECSSAAMEIFSNIHSVQVHTPFLLVASVLILFQKEELAALLETHKISATSKSHQATQISF